MFRWTNGGSGAKKIPKGQEVVLVTRSLLVFLFFYESISDTELATVMSRSVSMFIFYQHFIDLNKLIGINYLNNIL